MTETSVSGGDSSKPCGNGARLRYEAMRDLYQAQRERRETIRNSVATPVAALAFSVFDLSTIAVHYHPAAFGRFFGSAIAIMVGAAVICLVAAAALIVRMEYGVIYLDPPDVEELVHAERMMIANQTTKEELIDRLHDFLAGSYHVAYHRYFSENEQAARDRTRGLRLILVALGMLSISFLLLPFQGP